MKNKLLVLVEDCEFIGREIVDDALDPVLYEKLMVNDS